MSLRQHLQYLAGLITRDAELQAARLKHGRRPEQLAAKLGCSLVVASDAFGLTPDPQTAEALVAFSLSTGLSVGVIWRTLHALAKGGAK